MPSYLPVLRPEWLALHDEPVLEPALPIIDAHHHLWLTPEFSYARPQLQADAASGHAVRATVFVDCLSHYREQGPEALRPVGETAFVMRECGAGQGGAELCAGIVGWADLRLGAAVTPVLEQHLVAGQGRFRGVRSRAAWHADAALHAPGAGDAGLLLQPRVQQAVRILGRLGLTLDVWVYHPQLQEVAQLAAACPQTTLVVNHCGGPLGVGPYAGRRDAVLGQWQAQIQALAQYPNSVMKLGGLAMPRCGFGWHAQPVPVDSATLAQAWAPYIDHCIAAFGVERCMFESNFPMDKSGCSYRTLWNAFKRLAHGGSASEKAALFEGTAARVYRL
ncbi:MAG: amidohydrolase family protein [Comamonas sp.]